ncbi:carbohydrate ABC transporter permease [Nocardioides mesophilus]|uniref:Sugar ABC transporter permease n=1 Tax=Nocardioides mesophilus TaxID=433659 RepID=A0A7G9RBP8_9ACTN|nr:sugar ABC transporter permease [Nocardioides mesophilus]QNN53023.1 sugar ABC transporter permease [Nocardioides mesophilus]
MTSTIASVPPADEERRTGARRPAGPGPRRGTGLTPRWLPWLLLAPALAVLGGLLLYPLYRVLVLSLQDFGLRQLVTGESQWVGLDNFAELLTDPLLWKVALPNTVVFAVVNVVLTVGLGTLVALLLARVGVWTRGVLTSAIMVAWAMPAVTGTYVWVLLFDPRSGMVMRGLSTLGLVDPDTTNWFTERLPFYAIATLNVVHHGFPFVAVTVLAALMTLPQELMEAAELDGAGAWRRFWSVTVPLLKPVFAVVTILSTIWDFKVFTQIYLMPGGSGTNRDVLNLGTWSYITAISQNRYGLGAAIAVLLTALLLVITAVYLRTLFRQEEL